MITGVFIVIITAALIVINRDWILSIPDNVLKIYSIFGNTISILSGLVVLLGALITTVSVTDHLLIQRLPVSILSLLCYNQKWSQELSPKDLHNVRDFLIGVHRLALVNRLTNTGLETILTPDQFLSGVKIPKRFIDLDVRNVFLEIIEDNEIVDTFNVLVSTQKKFVSAKHFMIFLLCLAVRGGYSPTETEFRSIWFFVLELIYKDKHIPRSLTEDEKLDMVKMWIKILPISKSIIIMIQLNQPVEQIYNNIKSLSLR